MQQIKQLKLASSLLFTSSPVLFSFIFYWTRVRSEGMTKNALSRNQYIFWRRQFIGSPGDPIATTPLLQSAFFSRSQSTTEKKREKWIDKKKISLTAQKYLKKNELCNISHDIKQSDIYLRSRHFLPANPFFGGQS